MTTFQPHHFYFVSDAQAPALEIYRDTQTLRIPLTRAGPGREPGEGLWMADLRGALPAGEWQFRVATAPGEYDAFDDDRYTTELRALWLQDGHVFDYQPAPRVSPYRMVKVARFQGNLPTRALYIYLPRGYEQHLDKHYPVIYMHDGQNCFETFVSDSYVGSWKADITANNLIQQGLMRECIIVGVSNAGERRMIEYAPPYIQLHFLLKQKKAANTKKKKARPPKKAPFGAADQTAAYYRDEVAPYIRQNYRVLPGREHTALCGSSMGGLLTTYFAWEHPAFARHYAALSPAYGLTRTPEGDLEPITRLRTRTEHDFRLWLDSGTRTTRKRGDDGMQETRAVRDALLENGFVNGSDFRYYLDEGAIHHETAWAARLPQVFRFLFPTT